MGLLLGLSNRAYQLAARVLASPAAAEDVVQGAYIKALRHPPEPRSAAEVRAWFFSIVVNTARQHMRGEGRRRRREAAVSPRPGRGRDGDRRELIPALNVALASLDEKYRLLLALCYEQDMSQSEAARVLDMPVSTAHKYVKAGLEKLRKTLARAGYAALPAAVLGGLKETAPAVPASLAGRVEALVAQGAMKTGTGVATATSAVVKGGLVMKAIAGIVAAGTLAGAVAVSMGMGGGASPAVGDGKPAPVNPYKGMQEREEVYEFTAKPAVKKEGDKWVITFASKGACDATVSILDKEGKIIRHLASGVLGANAPHPFQQNSLSQKIGWDGLTDDFRKAAPAGCKVKVLLGLGAKFERNIAWDPHLIATIHWQEKNVLTAVGPDGSRYVGGAVGTVFGKDGKYVRTFWPPPAAEAEKVMTGLGFKFATTTWGDKVMVCSWFGPFTDKKQLSAVLMAQPGAGGVKEGPAPADLNRPQLPTDVGFPWYMGYNPRITVDPANEEIYVKFCQNTWGVCRFNGKTGELDKAWPLHGKKVFPNELDVGPDGLLYIVTGNHGYSKAISRVGHDGKAAPFKDESEQMDPSMKVVKDEWQIEGSARTIGAQKVLVTGVSAHSNTHDKGFDVSPAFGGRMVLVVENAFKPGWDAKYGVPAGGKGLAVQVWDTDGRLITANAVGVAPHWWRHGARMDRDGNLYLVVGAQLPAGQAGLDGIADLKAGGGGRIWGTAGTLVKFRYQGRFPTGGISGIKDAPADALKLTSLAVTGAHWAYGGVPNSSKSNDCTCNHNRFDLDGFARSWIPANQLYSVMVIDSNGNRIARLGRYGNVDDTEADLKEKKDGLRFAWPRAVAVSDTAAYVIDNGNRRILKAALGYAAEETVPLP